MDVLVLGQHVFRPDSRERLLDLRELRGVEDSGLVEPARMLRRRRAVIGQERQVLFFVFEGLANKEIAERLGVSESSVKATLQQLFAKTGTHTRAQLVRIALEQHKHKL